MQPISVGGTQLIPPHQHLNEELKQQAKGSQPDPMDFGEPRAVKIYRYVDDDEEFKSGENIKVLGLGLADLAARPNSAIPVMNQQREKLA